MTEFRYAVARSEENAFFKLQMSGLAVRLGVLAWFVQRQEIPSMVGISCLAAACAIAAVVALCIKKQVCDRIVFVGASAAWVATGVSLAVDGYPAVFSALAFSLAAVDGLSAASPTTRWVMKRLH